MFIFFAVQSFPIFLMSQGTCRPFSPWQNTLATFPRSFTKGDIRPCCSILLPQGTLPSSLITATWSHHSRNMRKRMTTVLSRHFGPTYWTTWTWIGSRLTWISTRIPSPIAWNRSPSCFRSTWKTAESSRNCIWPYLRRSWMKRRGSSRGRSLCWHFVCSETRCSRTHREYSHTQHDSNAIILLSALITNNAGTQKNACSFKAFGIVPKTMW